jgi:hypothetical protein
MGTENRGQKTDDRLKKTEEDSEQITDIDEKMPVF